MSFSPPWRSACALPNAPSPALRVKTPRPDKALSAGLGALRSRGSWRAEAGGRLARPPPRSAGRWTEGHPDPFQKQVPTRVLPTPAFGTARQLRARLPRCLSRPSHPVFSHRNRLCVTTTQKTEGSSAEGGGRGAGSPPGPGPHLCSRPCPPSSFPSRDSSLRRSQMPPRPGMTGIPRRSWQTGALLAQVPGPRPALQGRESHRASWSRGRPRRSRPTGSLALSERLSCFPFPGFLAAKL